MKNRISVVIDGQEYNLVASEDAAYMKKVAEYVDAKLQAVRAEGVSAAVDVAILAALNMADEHFKGQGAEENLRLQIKESLEENKKLNLELSEAKREIFRLQSQGRKS